MLAAILLDQSWISVLNLSTGAVIPLLVGVLTKKLAPSGLKATLNAFLSGLSGALTVIIASGGEVVLPVVLSSMLTTFIASVAMYYGLWKPTGVSVTVEIGRAHV